MIKICDLKTEIEELDITMNKVITILVFNFFHLFFVQFFGILSHEAREKEKLATLESFAKFLENKKL